MKIRQFQPLILADKSGISNWGDSRSIIRNDSAVSFSGIKQRPSMGNGRSEFLPRDVLRLISVLLGTDSINLKTR